MARREHLRRVRGVWQIIGLLGVATLLTLAFGAALLALDRLNR
jgi:hypothetical protein